MVIKYIAFFMVCFIGKIIQCLYYDNSEVSYLIGCGTGIIAAFILFNFDFILNIVRGQI